MPQVPSLCRHSLAWLTLLAAGLDVTNCQLGHRALSGLRVRGAFFSRRSIVSIHHHRDMSFASSLADTFTHRRLFRKLAHFVLHAVLQVNCQYSLLTAPTHSIVLYLRLPIKDAHVSLSRDHLPDKSHCKGNCNEWHLITFHTKYKPSIS